MDAMRAQLDSLMGINRDGDKTDELNKKYDDRDICRYHLVGLCPHDLFTNTKIDMGSCGKQHSNRLKKEYEEAYAKGKANYDRELLEYLDKLIVECDRKISRAMKRLEEDDPDARTYTSISKCITTDEVVQMTKDLKERHEKLNDEGNPLEEKAKLDLEEEIAEMEDKRAVAQATALLASFKDKEKEKAEDPDKPLPPPPELELDAETKAAIATKMAEAEALGEEGDIDGAQRKMEEVEGIKKLALLKGPPKGPELMKLQDQKLRVCDICGAFLSIYDSDRRLADHFGGKMHLGYCQIREKIKAIQDNMYKPKLKERERSVERGSAEKRTRSRDRDSGRDKDRDGGRDRDRDRHKDNDRDRGREDSHRDSRQDSHRDSRRDSDRDRDRGRDDRDRGRDDRDRGRDDRRSSRY